MTWWRRLVRWFRRRSAERQLLHDIAADIEDLGRLMERQLVKQRNRNTDST